MRNTRVLLKIVHFLSVNSGIICAYYNENFSTKSKTRSLKKTALYRSFHHFISYRISYFILYTYIKHRVILFDFRIRYVYSSNILNAWEFVRNVKHPSKNFYSKMASRYIYIYINDFTYYFRSSFSKTYCYRYLHYSRFFSFFFLIL